MKGIWEFEGTDLLYELTFIARETLMIPFTYILDVDITILNQLDEQSLRRVCQVNQYARSLCQNEKLWRLRINRKFGNAAMFRDPNQTWAEYYRSLMIIVFAGKFTRRNPKEDLCYGQQI